MRGYIDGHERTDHPHPRPGSRASPTTGSGGHSSGAATADTGRPATPLDRPPHPLGHICRSRRDDRERAPDLRGLRAVREPGRPELPQPVRRRPLRPRDPAGWLARRRPELALRPDVAARLLRPALRVLPRGERRVAIPALPADGRPRSDRDDEVLPAAAQGAPAPGEAQPAAEARLHHRGAAGRAGLLTGLSIYKPTQFSWLTALFGGFQAARYWHFWIVWIFVAFSVTHVLLVLLVDPASLRAMLT